MQKLEEVPTSGPYLARQMSTVNRRQQGKVPTPFIEGVKLAAEASRFARGSSGNLADSPLVSGGPLVRGDAPRFAVPACPDRVGVARRLSCLVRLRAFVQSRRNAARCHDGSP